MFSGPDTPIVIVGNKLDLVRELPKVKSKSNIYKGKVFSKIHELIL